MENIFRNISKEDLCEIYKDYLGSKELGIGVSSFKKYAREIKEKYFSGVEMILADCIEIVQKMFFEEVARRYFK